MANDVIELSSSPEPSPPHIVNTRHPHKSSRRAPKRIYDGVVIELTDSEKEENDAMTLRNSKQKAQSQPVAGPSRLVNGPTIKTRSLLAIEQPMNKTKATAPIHPSNRNNSPARLSPRLTLHQGPSKTAPLFLPSDDDNNSPHRSQSRLERTVTPTHNADPNGIGGIDKTPSPEPVGLTQETTIQPEPPSDVDPVDNYAARVLEIIPDVRLDHLIELILKHMPTSKNKVVDTVVSALCEDVTYPRSESRGKRKRVAEGAAKTEDEGKSSKVKIDYANKERGFKGGPGYEQMAVEQLSSDFPQAPMRYVRRIFKGNNNLYAPTYLFLDDQRKKGQLPLNSSPSRKRSKGKGKVLENSDFEAERQWLLDYQQSKATDAVVTASGDPPAEQEDDDGIECGCCFSTYAFDKMIQCPDAHLFCNTCITSYASGLLGAHNHNIVCMDQSGCKLAFPESELRRMLTKKLMDLYERVKQTKEIETAGLENLEECPFCEYKVVIENENEKLFRCENDDCAAVTCRGCKKLDHLPKSCKEVEEDRHLDGRHHIEEAMTRALMRNCPKCQKAFVKETGCNKMTCPHCHTMSCYNCRQLITGYEHFDRGVPGSSTSTKCKLWEPVELRHQEEVTAAAKKALEEYKRQHPDVEEKDINVDLPAPVPAPALVQVAANMFMAPHPPPPGYQQQLQFPRMAGIPQLPAPFGQPYNAHPFNAAMAPAIPVFPPPRRRARRRR